MKNIESLKVEQKALKAKLAELVDFITSEEYYQLSESEKGLINQQRTGMELYLSTLTKRIYGKADVTDTTNMIWLTMLMGMFNSPSTGFGGSSSADYLKKTLEEDEAKALTDHAV